MWGRLLGLDPAGAVLRCLDVRAWEEVLALVRKAMHRVETLYVDEASSGVQSLASDFAQRTGSDPADFLA
jgi:hypothetical protein